MYIFYVILHIFYINSYIFAYKNVKKSKNIPL